MVEDFADWLALFGAVMGFFLGQLLFPSTSYSIACAIGIAAVCWLLTLAAPALRRWVMRIEPK